ncbi:MAG: 4'-phosphopantetheinyl transferase superfamily protein [Betaproteobacteria bacterium]
MSVDDFPIAGNPAGASTEPVALSPVAAGIALWWCELTRSDAEMTRLAEWLSPSEHARAARFGTAALRRRWTAGRGTLRLLLARTIGVAPDAVALARGVRGRPQLADASLGVDFNVSNTLSVALVAIARGLPAPTRIGVDIEHEDRAVGTDRLATKFLTPREHATLDPLAAEARRQRFLRHWTCKEAMSKATGEGLAAPFGRLDIDVDAGPCVVAGPPPYDPQAWTLHAVDVPEGFLATIAVWHGGPALPPTDAAANSV